MSIIIPTRINQTSAQWAVDATVYSINKILVTTDVFYGATDQPKFKLANGIDVWSALDYFPVSGYDDATSSIQTQLDVKSNGDICFYRKTGTTTIERWYTSAISCFTTTATATARDLLRATPFIVPKTITLDRIGMEITTGGTAGSLVRLGIYNSINGIPDSLVLDSGVDKTSGTGLLAGDSATFQSIEINKTLQPGLYWLVYIHNSAASISFRAMTAPSVPQVIGANPTLGATTSPCTYSSAVTYSTLPSTFDYTGFAAVSTNPPIISVRFSA